MGFYIDRDHRLFSFFFPDVPSQCCFCLGDVFLSGFLNRVLFGGDQRWEKGFRGFDRCWVSGKFCVLRELEVLFGGFVCVLVNV